VWQFSAQKKMKHIWRKQLLMGPLCAVQRAGTLMCSGHQTGGRIHVATWRDDGLACFIYTSFFRVSGPKFTKLFSPNVEKIVVGNAVFRLSIPTFVPEIFAIRV